MVSKENNKKGIDLLLKTTFTLFQRHRNFRSNQIYPKSNWLSNTKINTFNERMTISSLMFSYFDSENLVRSLSYLLGQHRSHDVSKLDRDTS